MPPWGGARLPVAVAVAALTTAVAALDAEVIVDIAGKSTWLESAFVIVRKSSAYVASGAAEVSGS